MRFSCTGAESGKDPAKQGNKTPNLDDWQKKKKLNGGRKETLGQRRPNGRWNSSARRVAVAQCRWQPGRPALRALIRSPKAKIGYIGPFWASTGEREAGVAAGGHAVDERLCSPAAHGWHHTRQHHTAPTTHIHWWSPVLLPAHLISGARGFSGLSQASPH